VSSALAAIQSYATSTSTPVTATAVVAPATTSPAQNFNTALSALTTQENKAFAKISKIDGDGTITYLDKAGNTNFYTSTNAPGASTATGVAGQKLAVINPSNPGALEKMGGSSFRIAAGSGVPAAGFSLTANAANGTSEKIFSNSLEQSNVDMATQFVKMILTQRAYSANSKTITTADEMTQEVLSLKR
jgi:flagellar hook protein FlgE